MERRDHGGAESHKTSQPKIESPADHFVPPWQNPRTKLQRIRGRAANGADVKIVPHYAGRRNPAIVEPCRAGTDRKRCLSPWLHRLEETPMTRTFAA
jgi:hypothetical protein